MSYIEQYTHKYYSPNVYRPCTRFQSDRKRCDEIFCDGDRDYLGKELTGMIVSAENIEDIFSDMDSGEGHFVYDSH